MYKAKQSSKKRASLVNINYLKSGINGDERRRKLTSYAMDFKIINNL